MSLVNFEDKELSFHNFQYTSVEDNFFYLDVFSIFNTCTKIPQGPGCTQIFHYPHKLSHTICPHLEDLSFNNIYLSYTWHSHGCPDRFLL